MSANVLHKLASNSLSVFLLGAHAARSPPPPSQLGRFYMSDFFSDVQLLRDLFFIFQDQNPQNIFLYKRDN